MTSSPDCVVCGTCVADMLVRPVPLEQPIGGGRLVHVDPIALTTGGIVCNTGIALRRLGVTVAAAGMVGDDVWGREIRSRLDREDIRTGMMEMRDGVATSSTAVLIDPAGERSFLHHVGAAGDLDLAFVQRHIATLAACRYCIVGYLGLLPRLEPRLAEAVALIRSAGCRVVVETAGGAGAMADLVPALPSIDVFVPSLDEARVHTQTDDPHDMIACYRRHGAAGIVGVKRGAEGTLLSPSPGLMVEIPCIAAPEPVIDTTGAGDSFLAGFVAGLIRGMTPAESGRLGAAAAAWCVTRAGATAGLRSFDDTLSLARG